MKTTLEHVMQLTGITEEEYTDALLDQGREYLKDYCRGDEAGIKALIETPEFWKWYRDVWDITDGAFVMMYIGSDYARPYLRDRWHRRHSRERMVCTIGADVLDAGYARMFDKVTKKPAAK